MSLFLSYKLRKASNTSMLENRKNKLLNDHQEFTAYEQSQDLLDFIDLEKEVNSDDFKQDCKRVEAMTYKGSDLEKKELELQKLSKSKEYKIYSSVQSGSEFAEFNKMADLSQIKRYQEFEAAANTGKLSKAENKEAWLEYNEMKKLSMIRNYIKFKDSKDYKVFLEVEASGLTQKIENLKSEQASETFISEKIFLLDKKRFEKTEAYNKLISYKEISESELLKKYNRLKKKNNFDKLGEWELTFSEDFEGDELDKNKWITRYYWGDVLMNDGFALPNDAHIFSEKNIKVSNSIARLETRRENAQGKVWDKKFGFRLQDFDYTSALISTGKSFRQKYGRFEAKIKMSDIKNVMHAFWMLSEKSLPHIDIAKTSSCGKLQPGHIMGNENKPVASNSKVKGLDWTKDFFIYSLDWTADKLVWKINDVVVKTQMENIPQEPMYLILSSGVSNANANVNAAMEIDWVKCYQKS